MKKFLVISLLLLFLAAPAGACVYLGRPHYYVFSVFNRDLMGNTYDRRVDKFWEDYTGESDIHWDVEALSSVDYSALKKSNNVIIKKILAKRDSEALAYVKQLSAYLEACGSARELGEDWEYPTREELAAQARELGAIRKAALAYKGYRFRPQYALLVMRTFMLQQSYASIKEYWMTTGSKLPESVYKDMMKGIYAGALYHTGSRDVACRLYAELGDMQSLKWCVRDMRNLEGIKKEYAANPNSPTLIFLVQDFVNNAQETLDHNSDPETMQYIEATGIYAKEVAGFIEFAKQVEAEGKTEVPALWHSASGFLHFFRGDYYTAQMMLEEAQNLAGTPRMKDNARACRLIVLAHDEFIGGTPNYDNITAEMQWLSSMISDDDPHYEEVMQRLIYHELVPLLRENNKSMLATALLAWGHENGYEGYHDDYKAAIESLSAMQLINYKRYVDSPATNSFERMVLSNHKSFEGQEELNDLIGTKYLREGQFAQAIPYLEKVSMGYISKQSISRYAAARDFKRDRWFGRQVVDRNWEDMARGATATLKSNAKLLYCRDMVNLLAQYDAATGEERLALAYTLASRYYQASYRGDCWYLAHYGVSSMDEPKDYEMDFGLEAKRYLREAKGSTNFELRQKSLYALAFITQGQYGESCVMSSYDWNLNATTYSLNRDVENYDPMLDLYRFYQANTNQAASYVSKCDYLRRFATLY